MKAAKPTIYFTTKLCKGVKGVCIVLPKSFKGDRVEGVINGLPFRGVVKEHKLTLTKAMHAVCKAEDATVEITYVDDEEETRIPKELSTLLKLNPKAQSVWNEATVIARGDWILWITSAKKAETRLSRIEKAISMLSSGKKRICCFGGRNWLIKTS